MPQRRFWVSAHHQDNNKAHKTEPIICQTHLWILASWREVYYRDTDTRHTPALQLHTHNIMIDGKRQLRLVINHNQLICLGQI